MIRSVDRGRAPAAPFFKPVCVIAAIDLADRGQLVSDLLHSELIVRQFAEYVEPFFPDRAANGWQPLWFLSNDGLWTFFRKGKPLDRSSFDNGMPRTKKKLFEKIDAQEITPAYKTLWDSAAARKELRDEMLLMLSGNAGCHALVAPLLDPARFHSPERWPDEQEVAAYLGSIRKQYDLFGAPRPSRPASDAAARANAGDAIAAFNLDALPPVTPVGPELIATGMAPISLEQSQVPVGTVQRDLYLLVRAKCQVLLRALPMSSNRAAQLRPPVGLFADALKPEASKAQGHILWSHGNTLRRLNDADLRARSSTNPDIVPLPEDIGELLSDLVEQFNVYARHEPLLQQLDNARIGPAGRAEAIERFHAGRRMLEAAARFEGILEPHAAEVLATATETAERALETPGLDADQAIANSVEMQRNGARAMLQSAVLEFRKWFKKTKGARSMLAEGALKETGAEAVRQLKFVSFVNAAAKLFRELWKGHDGLDIVEKLIEWLRNVGP